MDAPFVPLLDREVGPLWRQAAERLRAAIVDGVLPVGTALPREADLAARFGVSMITIRRALAELESDGFVRKRVAKPAVVAGIGRLEPVARDINSFEDIIAATAGARLEIDDYRLRRSAEAAAVFGLPMGTRVHCLRGRLAAGDTVLSDLAIYFAPAIGAQLRVQDFDDVVVFRAVQRRLGIRLSGARITVAAERADAAVAGRLGTEEGAAILVNRMLYLDVEKKPVELTIARHRGDRHRLSYELRAT